MMSTTDRRRRRKTTMDGMMGWRAGAATSAGYGGNHGGRMAEHIARALYAGDERKRASKLKKRPGIPAHPDDCIGANARSKIGAPPLLTAAGKSSVCRGFGQRRWRGCCHVSPVHACLRYGEVTGPTKTFESIILLEHSRNTQIHKYTNCYL